MKKALLAIVIILFSFPSQSQLLSWTPDFIGENSTPVVITVDATRGNQGLINYSPTSDVYVHIGVITSSSSNPGDWKHVPFTWGTTDPSAQAAYLGNNKWSYTITGGLRTFFGLTDPTETIQKIAILFRNGSGSLKQANTDGSDMYVPVYASNLAVRFTQPPLQPTYNPQPETITKNVGDNIAITGVANNAAALTLYFNGAAIQTAANATTISANPSIVAPGNQTLILNANDGTTSRSDTISFFVTGGVTVAPLPQGVRDGINYEATDTAATLVLYAPGKTRVSVIGEFPANGWQEQTAYEMNKSPDGNYWWLRIRGLTPGTEYAYQYLVDGTLKIADPYTEKVLDPGNDGSIPASTYPSLKAYPTGSTTGIVSILQTTAPAYTWKINSFSRPDKRNLVIYELLLRDFVAAHDWKTLKDTLTYLKSLGINTIEVMPFNEFEGNNSWGYNPDFYFAPDKYYGPANTLKEFIDSCHSNGIAVVMDMVLNHSFGSSPLVQLYFDNANNRPAVENPWFNPVAKHAYNVGYDMNHESLATRYFVSRVVEHWLTNYKIDGFRFDLSKGFTQKQTCDSTGNNCNTDAFAAYDSSRVAIWKRYYDTLQLKSPGCYAILEHFSVNQEEKDLADYGMMPWGNMNYNYNQASMGYLDNNGSDLSYGIYSSPSRGWTQPNLVTYMESHDEERLMYKNLQYGNATATYNIKDTATALKRNELDAAFFFTIPGPKMIWQFGELGYNYSINHCQDGSINDSCRTDQKPSGWGFLQDANRKHLHDVYSSLIKLRSNPYYADLFASGQITDSVGGGFKWLKVTKDISSLVAVGNFDTTSRAAFVTFPAPGIWYDYLNATTITATGLAQAFTLQPGEYHVYLNRNAALPVTLINFSGKNTSGSNVLSWSVENELNVIQYELQRSTNGRDYSFVADVNASGRSNYTYADKITINTATTFFYRLKSTDKDGRISYSAVVKISTAGKTGFIQVAPNPFKEKLSLNIQSYNNEKADLMISDVSGRRLIKKNVLLNQGNNAVDVKEVIGLCAGTYFLTVVTSTQTQSIKIIKRS